MQRDLKRLASEHYDLLVIGGGINGLAAAWDAALRGLKTALVEKSDFGASTSSATLKLVHGGLRYLQHLDIVRMRQSIRERSNMLHIAPHLVAPLPFLIPTHGHLINGKEAMSAAIILNDLISCDRNRRIQDPERRLPNGRIWLTRRQTQRLVPDLDPQKMTGGVVFYDAQMYNSERLTLAFALSAAERGADLANYLRADKLIEREGRIVGATVSDLLGGERFDIQADMTLNMTGPWSDIMLDQIDNPAPSRRVLRSKGIQIVVPRLTEIGLAVPSSHRDPDSVIDVGGRRYFITPWRGHSLVGTTDTVFEGDPDDFRISDADIRDFVAEINACYPSAALRREDVKFAFGGLRPITEENIDSGSTVSRKYEIYDHARDLRLEGLVSVIGVKYTTCRFLAEKVLDLVFRKMGRSSPRPATESTRLIGGEIDSIGAFTGEAVLKDDGLYGEKAICHLVCNFGTQYRDVLGLAEEDPMLGTFVSGSDEVLKAEVLYAIRNESAQHLDDIVLRRTDLGTLGHPGRAALEDCAELAARELGWDDFIRANELARAEDCFRFA
jgi:glycerol-3-phosphate dehydrogenase